MNFLAVRMGSWSVWYGECFNLLLALTGREPFNADGVRLLFR